MLLLNIHISSSGACGILSFENGVFATGEIYDILEELLFTFALVEKLRLLLYSGGFRSFKSLSLVMNGLGCVALGVLYGHRIWIRNRTLWNKASLSVHSVCLNEFLNPMAEELLHYDLLIKSNCFKFSLRFLWLLFLKWDKLTSIS